MAQTLRLASKPLLSSPPVFVFAGFSFLIYLYGYISIYSSFPIPFGYQNLISLAQLNSSWSAILISITIASLFPRFANNISRSTNRLHIQILEKSSHKSRRSQLTLISMIVLSFCTLIAVIVLFVFFSQLGLIADNRIFTAKAEYILILLFFSLSLGYAAYARPLSFPIKLFLLFQAFIVSNSIFLIDNSRFCFMPLFSMALGFLIRRMYILGFLSTAYSFLLVGAVLYNRSYDIEITVLSLFLPISINTLADVVLGSLNYTLGFSALNTTYLL